MVRPSYCRGLECHQPNVLFQLCACHTPTSINNRPRMRLWPAICTRRQCESPCWYFVSISLGSIENCFDFYCLSALNPCAMHSKQWGEGWGLVGGIYTYICPKGHIGFGELGIGECVGGASGCVLFLPSIYRAVCIFCQSSSFFGCLFARKSGSLDICLPVGRGRFESFFFRCPLDLVLFDFDVRPLVIRWIENNCLRNYSRSCLAWPYQPEI